jgi:hypothetical protein
LVAQRAVVESRQALPSADFSEFLYAPIGEQRNGTPISVLSALVRLERDPWPEAERLARLPKERALRDIACVIEQVPGGDWPRPQSEAIAARLVKRLPTGKTPGSARPAGRELSVEVICVLALMWFVFAVVLAAFSLEHYRKPGASEAATAPAAATISSKAAPRPAWWHSI